MNHSKTIAVMLLCLGLLPDARLAADEKEDALVGTFTVYERWGDDGRFRSSQRHGGKVEIARDGDFYTVDFAPKIRFKKVGLNGLKGSITGGTLHLLKRYEVGGQAVITAIFGVRTLYLTQGEPPKLLEMAIAEGYRWHRSAPRREKWQPIVAGRWRAWIEREATNDPLISTPRAIRYRQTVFRMGPDDSEPTQLYEEASTGRTRIALGEDGTLLVSPVGDWPRLYFASPNRADNMAVIRILGPQKSIRLDGPAWILGDVLVYGRKVLDLYLVGYVRFDSVKRRIVEQRLVVKIREDPVRRDKNVRAASFTEVKPVRVDNYVFWRNRGDPGAERRWAESRLRVIDLKQGKLVALDSIEPKLLKKREKELQSLKPGK